MSSLRQTVPAVVLLLLSGCSMFEGSSSQAPGSGLVVGDEPDAVQVGAGVLAHGGNAVDAEAATYFALSVTYPVAAGLGGGGLCIVHDTARSRTESFNFLARAAGRGGAYAVPGNVGGFSLLQAAYGQLPWQRVVSPAEGLAAAGFPISRALSERLEASQDLIRLDAGLAAEFLDESGHVKPTGVPATAPALAQSLSVIREMGPAGFYRGSVANAIIAYSGTAGGALTAADLASFRAERSQPMTANVGAQTVYLPPTQTGAGRFAGSLLSRLVGDRGQPATGDLAGAVASATKATLDAYGLASLPRDLGATGFAAEDQNGLSVACAVTMNGPFGSVHTAKDTGITLARSPAEGQAGLAAAFLTPVIALSDGSVSLAGAGAGGPNGTAGAALALLKLGRGEDVLRPGALHSTGIAPFDTVNVIGCQNGVCAALPDPGAHGLGAAGSY